LHLDLYTSDQESEVERLIKLGAKRYPGKYQPDDDFIKLEDPDSNDFCVVQKAATEALARDDVAAMAAPKKDLSRPAKP
jgi:hypothetical protein